jgi:hypothetical protein
MALMTREIAMMPTELKELFLSFHQGKEQPSGNKNILAIWR